MPASARQRFHQQRGAFSAKPYVFLRRLLFSYNRDEKQQQAEVLYLSLDKGNMVPQFKHNPWSLKCHQQHLQRMKENAKHRNQYSILSQMSRRRRWVCVWGEVFKCYYEHVDANEGHAPRNTQYLIIA